MPTQTSLIERRKEVRLESSDVLRWKRPGHVEDNKAWTVDRSPSGFGFMARIEDAPKVGDRLHIRRYDADRWDTIDGSFRVARTEPATEDLLVVGCVIDESDGADSPSA